MKDATPILERLRGYQEGKPRRGPETVHIDVINACNLACITCWNHAPGLVQPKSPEWKARRMKLGFFQQLVNELADFGVERILLGGGGEPFLHPEIYDLIHCVKERGIRLTILSNGTLCDWERLRLSGLDQLLLNVSAGTASTYAAYHPGQPEARFEQLLKAAASLRGSLAINLVQVINGLNVRELPLMVQEAHDCGARISFKLGDLPPGTEVYGLKEGDLQELQERILPETRSRLKELKVRHNLEAFEAQCLHSPKQLPAPCFAGYLYSRIQIDGRVCFCCEPIEVGRLEGASFRDIWNGEQYQALRQRLQAGRFFPGCARCGKHDMNHAAQQVLQGLLVDGSQKNRRLREALAASNKDA